VARLSGTGLIADDLYPMAHDDVTGRPFLQPRAVGLGLAGGLLAELVLRDMLRLAHGWVVTGHPGQPCDELGHCVLGLIVSEREPAAPSSPAWPQARASTVMRRPAGHPGPSSSALAKTRRRG